MRSRISWVIFSLCAINGFAVLAACAQAPVSERTGGQFAQWRAYLEWLHNDPVVIRAYAFDGPLTADTPVPNRAGDGTAPLAFQKVPAANARAETFTPVAGRWPEKKAVRLDQSCYSTPAPDFGNRSFTATLWFRMHGQGAHRGNDGTTNGMLLCVGNGYYDGWRVTVSESDRRLSMEIGRPPGSVGMRTAPVADNLWHFLAASWDGKIMRLHLDGSLAAESPYSGDYTPPGNGLFRIGYADSGVGSVVLDVDEAVLYRRALTPQEVLRTAFFYANLTPEVIAHWTAAHAAFARKDVTTAEREVAALLGMKGLDPDFAAQARLFQADILQTQNENGKAATILDGIGQTPALPTRLRREADEKLLALVLGNGGEGFPASLYNRLMSLPQLTAEDRRSLHLGLGHSLVGAGDLSAARAEYNRILAERGASPAWRSLAGICIARTYIKERNYPAAKAAYLALRALMELPPYEHAEIEEMLQEVARLQAGKPAHDPWATRTFLPPRPAPGLTFVVAPNGTAKGNGTTQRPFATLEQARDAIRARRKHGGLPHGGVTVLVHGGRYATRKTFVLTSQDSGALDAPIVYRAAPGEHPIFDAGAPIHGFRPVTDSAVLERLPESARAHVRQTDLKAQGIADFGTFTPGGFASARGFKTHPLLELFFNGEAMPLAHWPNIGFVHIADIPAGEKGTFAYSEDRPARWKDEKDAWLYGYWFYDWADSYEKIGQIDTDKKTITLAPPATTYGEGGAGVKKGQRYRAVNVLSEIDTSGEWYLDRETGILYFYPPSDPARAQIAVSFLETPAVTMDRVVNLTLEGLTFENGRGDGVILNDCTNCLLHGCIVRQFAGNGVEIQGGTHDGLLSCDIHTLGRGGTILRGGDRKTLAPGGHFIENCRVYDFSRIDHTYTPAVQLVGVGNRIVHNLFHHGNSSAMRIEGNNNRIEYNEVRNVLLESDDQGASDMWGNFTYRGNAFRYNYWHDMGNGLGVGQAGIRLDDFISGTLIYGNIFQRCADGGFGGVQINQGADNVIVNNLFVDCKATVTGGAGTPDAWKRFIEGTQGKGYIEEVNALQPPYSLRYPALLRMGVDPKNSLYRNLAVQCGGAFPTYRFNVMDNGVTSANPGLIDPEKGNFAIRDGSPLSNRLSFRPIPVSDIGLYPSPFRHE